MASFSSRESLLLARQRANEVVEKRALHGSSYWLDDFLTALSRITMDAIDCALTAQPFHSETLTRFIDTLSTRDRESDMARFAYAFSRLMMELRGSIIETAASTVTDSHNDVVLLDPERNIKMEPVDSLGAPHFQLSNTETLKSALDAMFPVVENMDEVKIEEEIPLGLVKSEDWTGPEYVTIVEDVVDESQPGPSIVRDPARVEENDNRQIQAVRRERIQLPPTLWQLHEMGKDPVVFNQPNTTWLPDGRMKLSSKERLQKAGGSSVGGAQQPIQTMKSLVDAPKLAATSDAADRAACSSCSTSSRLQSGASNRSTAAVAAGSRVQPFHVQHCAVCSGFYDDLAEHEMQAHLQILLRDTSKCTVATCDFRAINKQVHMEHRKRVHQTFLRAPIDTSMIESVDATILIRTETRCPYCPYLIINFSDFISHMKQQKHRQMWNTESKVFVCDQCQFKCNRIYLLSRHWNENQCTKMMTFDYKAGREAIERAAAIAIVRPVVAAAAAADAASIRPVVAAASRQRNWSQDRPQEAKRVKLNVISPRNTDDPVE